MFVPIVGLVVMATSALLDQRREVAETGQPQEFRVESFGGSLSKNIQIARDAVSLLDDRRAKISGLTISVGEMASYYTPTIAKLLAIVEEMAVLSSNASATNTISAYTSFLQGKERAGQERAMGATGFGGGRVVRAVGNAAFRGRQVPG
ncbi:MAG: nitrate- and nitrite sensing domain-containing protein [Rhodospirillales bacterium]|nr:nitrate- and nitrite sensing domain-containing protein [Rhodospirillales bacterium]